jgi:hypothetical protein
MDILKKAISDVVSRKDLSQAEISSVMEIIMEGEHAPEPRARVAATDSVEGAAREGRLEPPAECGPTVEPTVGASATMVTAGTTVTVTALISIPIIPKYVCAGSTEYQWLITTSSGTSIGTWGAVYAHLGEVIVNSTTTYTCCVRCSTCPTTTLCDDVTVSVIGTGTPGLWVGGTPHLETDWDTGTNWDDGLVPEGDDDVVIPPACTYYPVLTDPLSVHSPMSSGDPECLSLTIEGGSLTTTSSIAVFSDGVFAVTTGNIGIGSNLTIYSHGAFDVTTGDIFIAGNWTNNGVFTCGTGTVTFDDASGTSTIAGNTTFYNFTCTTAEKELQFGAVETFTIGNDFTITGSTGHEVVLRSTTASGKWILNVGNVHDFLAMSM